MQPAMAQETPQRAGNANFERPAWTDRLRNRMSWIANVGHDRSKSQADSAAVLRAGLDDSARALDRWRTLALIRLQGEMGWTCKGCGALLNDPKAKVAIGAIGQELLVQARTQTGAPVAWMTLDTLTGQSFHFSIDRKFVRRDDSASADFEDYIRKSGRDQARKREAQRPEPKVREHVLREVDLMGQFSHFSSRVVDLDEQDRLRRLDIVSEDSVRFSRLASKAVARHIQPEELDALGLAANIGITSRSCYLRLSQGALAFRTRRTGAWRVTSTWNAKGQPVAWFALDTSSTFPFPLWFHVDRWSCLDL